MKCLALAILFIPAALFGQTFGDYIAKNALPIEEGLMLTTSVYKKIENLKLIMVGEMHGTKEPAALVQVLSDLILKYEGQVSVGMEIPANEIWMFTKESFETELTKSKFFSKENVDGRNGKAWFDLIVFCHKNPKINLFFFDNHQSMETESIDEAMYATLKTHIKQFPNSKTITISGNIHNSLIPYNGAPTMGSYCVNDSLNFSSDQICAINHIYSGGAMLNNIGNGLELRTIDYEESVYSQSVEADNYLLFYESAQPSRHNCIFYTKEVHPSEKLNKED